MEEGGGVVAHACAVELGTHGDDACDSDLRRVPVPVTRRGPPVAIGASADLLDLLVPQCSAQRLAVVLACYDDLGLFHAETVAHAPARVGPPALRLCTDLALPGLWSRSSPPDGSGSAAEPSKKLWNEGWPASDPAGRQKVT